jgi:hypothetical protein
MFTTRNRLWSDGMFTDDSGERVVALADVPITGAGSIALDNANANVFGVIVKSGANTATGTASVVAPTEGEGATTLYFANGANWAGTVVADGNVAMTNLVDAAASVTNTFGTLRLDADFPVRVWKSGGKVVANDYLVVDTFDGTERITLVEGDEALSGGDSFELGKIKAGGNLPKVVGRWNLSLGPEDDDGYCAITAKCVQGMMLIFL